MELSGIKVRCFLASIFAMIVFLPINAQVNGGEEIPVIADKSNTIDKDNSAKKSDVVYFQSEDLIFGKEHLFIKSKSTPTEENTLSTTDTASCIYISEAAIIVGKEYLFVKETALQDLQANTVEKQLSETKKKNTSPPVENFIDEEKTKTIVFALPFSPENLSSLSCGGESAIVVPQYRLNSAQFANKISRENRCLNIEKTDLPLYFPELRQKFSPTATQCGMLISFGPNSPSLS